MPSSVIRRFSYDASGRRLRVVFVSGEIYEYEGVPPDIASGLKAAASKGRFFGAAIRDRYPWRRVTDSAADPGSSGGGGRDGP